MPRKPRLHISGAFYHVILRGNDGADIFFGDRDFSKFYCLLQEATDAFNCRIHAFCCMTNHTHLVVQVDTLPLSRIIQNIAQRYTQWINHSKNRTGHVFQGRYQAILVDADAYLLRLVRYVHRNPVRAQLVEDVGKYRWCSHHAYLGKQKLTWLTAEFVLAMFSSEKIAALARYSTFVADSEEDELRSEFNSGACDVRVLGDDDFADKAVQKACQAPDERFTLSDVLTAVCSGLAVAEAEVLAPGKDHKRSDARAVTALIVEEAKHLSLKELAALCRRDPSGLGKSVQRLRKRLAGDVKLASQIEEIRTELHKSRNVYPDRALFCSKSPNV